MIGRIKDALMDKSGRINFLLTSLLLTIFFHPAVMSYVLLLLIIQSFGVRFNKEFYSYWHLAMYPLIGMVVYLINKETTTFEKEVVKYLSLIIVPFIFHHFKPFIKWKVLFRSFLFGSILFLIGLLILGIGRSIYFVDFNFLLYDKLAYSLHPGYLSLLCSILFVYVSLNPSLLTKNNLVIKVLLIVFVYLLSSRITWGIAFVLILVDVLSKGHQRHFSQLLYLPISIITIAMIVLFGQQNETRMTELKDSVTATESTESSSGVRFKMWRAIANNITEFSILGEGMVEGEKSLKELYQQAEIRKALDGGLNTHNQYLQSYIYQGFLGFLWLIFIPFLEWRRQKFNWKTIVALFPIYSFFVVESAMLRQMGLMLFLITLLFLPILSKQSLNENT